MNSIRVKLIITFVVLSLVTILFFTVGKIKAKIENDTVIVKCTFAGSTIVSLSEITSIKYVENFDIGKRNFGIETFKIDAGTYENEEFGVYKLYTYSKVDAYIIVHYGDKELVFNQSNIDTTKDIYEQLRSRVE